MKEYCLISVRKHKIIAKLHIVKYQFEELTDDKFETLVNKWILLAGGNCNIHVKHGDFIVKYRDKSENLYASVTEEGLDIILSKFCPKVGNGHTVIFHCLLLSVFFQLPINLGVNVDG